MRFLISFFLSCTLLCLVIPVNSQEDKNKSALTELTVVIHTGYENWQTTGGKITGVDYDLLTLFAKVSGKILDIIPVNTAADALEALEDGRASLAVGSLVMPTAKKETLAASVPYTTIEYALVYRYTDTPPEDLSEVKMKDISVSANPMQLELLTRIKRQNNDSSQWTLDKSLSTGELMRLVNQGLIRYSVASTEDINRFKLHYPNIKQSLLISEKLPVSWILEKENESLATEIRHFFAAIEQTRELENVLDRYFGHIHYLNYPAKLELIRKFNNEFVKYREIFQEIENAYPINWQLLAAISYQESRWDPRAQSVTGVKGMMMVTTEVANELKLLDLLDPVQNTITGAQYFLQLRQQLPKNISEPDRTWAALLAYNSGLGHLKKLIAKTGKSEKEPLLWVDIRDVIGLVERPKGALVHTYKPLTYVYNIRAYLKLIQWIEQW